MAALFGNINEFDAYTDQNWDEYIERLEHYFVANAVEEAEKKRAILLTVCGHKTYGLIRNLVSPDRPGDKTYDELKTFIHNHLKPKPLVIAERFKFHQRKQQGSETVSQYLTGQQKLSEHSEFGAFLNDALRDRFVCGLSSLVIQRKLLSEADLTLKKALDIALSMEMAAEEAKKLAGDGAERDNGCNKMSIECFRCGKSNHLADACFHKKSRCHNCHEVGHLVRKCSKKGGRIRNTTSKQEKSEDPSAEKVAEKKGKIVKKTSRVNKVACSQRV